jgi:dTDP-4-amino-4,6-dideoxygalactose transaminase
MIPFMDLKKQYDGIKDEIDQAIKKVLESSQFVLGDEVGAFEKEFSAYCTASYGIAVNSGTSALHLALLAAGVGPGDEVVTVSFTFVATTAAIIYSGAKPVFVDIDPISCTMDINAIKQAITNKTKAILPVHIHGQPANMDEIMRIAKKYNLVVIEDAAQAHGAEYKSRRVGSIGDLGCFSFYPGKNLGAYGEGGMVVTDNAEYAHKIRMLRDWGQEKKYYHKLKGYNYRMEGFQGAVLRVKLRYLEEWTEDRRKRASLYDKILSDPGIQMPANVPHTRHVYHVYAVRTPFRDNLQDFLQKNDIQTNIHYPIPVHMQAAYADLGNKEGNFPVTEKVARETLSLPIYPELPVEYQYSIAEKVLLFMEGTREKCI